MTAIIAGKRSTVPLRTIVYHYKNRLYTDKYWIALFVVSFVIWRSPWTRVIYPASNGSIEDETFEFVYNETDFDINVADEIANDGLESASCFTQENSFAVAVISFFNENRDNYGSAIIAAGILLCVSLIIYSFASVGSDKFTCKLYRFCIFSFLYTTFCTGLVLSASYRYKRSSEYFLSEFLWTLPFMALTFIWRAQPAPSAEVQSHVADRFKTVVHWKDYFLLHPSAVLCISVIMGISYLPPFAESCFDWKIELLDLVVLPAKCHVYLTIYYFFVTSISCATSISYERHNHKPKLKDLWRAMYIVGRYHFGTVCYHATLVLPRIQATIIANEAEPRRIPKLTVMDRFYLAQCKLHDMSLIMTASRGYDHAKSVRELWRLYANDTLKLMDLWTYNRIHRRISAFAIGIYGLVIIWLWTHGVMIEPRITIATGVAYSAIICITYAIMSFYDSSLGVLWFHQDDNVIIVH